MTKRVQDLEPQRVRHELMRTAVVVLVAIAIVLVLLVLIQSLERMQTLEENEA